MPDVLLAQASVAPVQVGNEFFCVCHPHYEWEEDRNLLCIFNLTLLLAFEIFLLRNRMREEVPSSATGFLHALEQRFCPL